MSKSRGLLIGFVLTLLMGGVLLSQDAEAYQIKRVVRGSTNLATGTEVVSVDLTSSLGSEMLDLDKSIVLITNSDSDTSDQREADVFATLDDDHTITLVRQRATATQDNVEYQVIEFVSGVTVISGISVLPDPSSGGATTGLTVDKTITMPDPLDVTKTFAVVKWKSYSTTSGATENEYYTVACSFTSISGGLSSKLRIQRSESLANYRLDVAYQVVNFGTDPDVTVQYGSTTVSTASNTATVTSVNTAKSILFMTYLPNSATNGDENQQCLDGVITNSTTLTFTRKTATSTSTANWFLVTFGDEAFVPNSNGTSSGASTRVQDASATTVAKDNTLPNSAAVTMNRAFNIHSTSWNASSQTTTGVDDVRVRAYLTSTTNLRMYREGTLGADTFVSYFVAELPPLHVTAPDGGETWTVGDTSRNITWEISKDLKTGGPGTGGTACAGALSAYHNLTIDAYVNNSWQEVAQDVCPAAAGDTGSYNWNVSADGIPFELNSTNVIGSNVKIRIRTQVAQTGSRDFDTSRLVFNIVGSLSAPAISGTQPLLIGDTGRTISWTQHGNLGDLKINVSTDGTTWNDGTLSLANSGGLLATVTPTIPGSAPFVCSGTNFTTATCTYTWSPIPDLSSAALKVRVMQTLKPLSSSTNPNSTLIVFTTSSAHGLTAGETVQVSGHNNSALTGGAVTGVVSATNLTTTNFSLTGVNGNNGSAGTAIGTISRGINGTSVVSNTSSAFEIRPSLTLTAPSATDQWNRGLTKNITWTATGTVGNVDIYLSYNNGSTYPTTIATNVSGGAGPTFSYAWAIGASETLSTGAKIKVVQTGQSPTSYTIGDTVPDTGDGAFDIIASLSLTNPVGSQSPPWRVANDETVAWTVGGGSGVTLVDVYYSTNCVGTNCATSATWTLQADDLAAGTGTYTWTNIPAGLKGAATGIKIVGNNNTNIVDIKGPFDTKAKVTIATLGPTWRVGDNQTITWTSYGSPAGLTVDWGTSGSGGPWPNNIATGVTGTSTSWNNIPSSAISSNVSVKIYEPSDANLTTGVASASSAFAVKPKISNVVLNSGCPGSCTPATLFSVGDTLRVTWTVAPGSLTDTVDIKLDTASGTGGFIYTVATATASAGYADWVIPNNSNYVRTTDRIRVVSQADSAVSADSGNGTSDFQIKGSLLITDPTGPWKIGSTQSIGFTSNGIASVDILYALDGATFSDPATYTKTVVSSLTATDGPNTYSWNPIPNDALDIAGSSIYNDVKTTIKFRVVDHNNAATYATTTTNITMRKQYLNISVPSTTLYVDDNTTLLSNITWTTKGNTNVSHPVKIFYSTNSGSDNYPNPIPVAGTALSDTGAYMWLVPDSIGANRRVRVKSSTDPGSVFDDMTTDFTIRGKIDTLVPSNSGIAYNYNTPIAISWYNHGTLGAMTVKFDNGSTVTTIKNLASTTANATNTYTWQTGEIGFPPAVGSTYKIKVEQDSDPSNVFTTSANNFRVNGVFALTTANSDGLWGNVGDTVPITWTKSPSTFADNSVYLYYSTTGATTCSDGSWVAITPAPNTTTGSPATWGFVVPNGAVNSTAFKLKIQDAASTDCSTVSSYDISDATNAQVKGRIATITAAGSPWQIGTAQSIGWTSNPSTQGNVLVEASINGAAYQPVTGNSGTSTVASQTSPFPWTIQSDFLSNDYEANVLFRVKLISDPNNVFAVLASPITIKKRYTGVNVPASTLVVSEANNISWTTQGNTGGGNQVVLSYDTSSGSGGFSGQINSGSPLTDTSPYSWTVPDSIGTNRVVRVKSNAFPTDVFGDSGTFSIKGKVVPDTAIDNLTAVVGQSATINFAKYGTIGNLKIEYIHNGNSTVITPPAAPGPEGTNQATSFNWSSVVATDSLSNNVIDVGGSQNSTLKFTGLTQAGGALEASATSATFQVRGDINTMQFDAAGTEGQVLYIGSSHLIRWKTNGDVGNVKIRVDTNNDGTFEQITGPDATYPNGDSVPYNYDGDGAGTSCGSLSTDYHCWEWTVPDNSSTVAQVRVESISNPWHASNPMATYALTSSSTPFRIRGTYSNVLPTTAVKWKVTSINNIDWTANGTMGNVNITLLYDSDANGSLDATSTLATNNSTKPFPWTIASGLVTESAKIRIQQTSDGSGTVNGDSAVFKIKPKLQLTLPNSNADQWVVGSQPDITWAAPVGSASAFKINVSTDGGTTWNDGTVTLANKGGEITPSQASASLAYTWTIPDAMTNQGVVRIRKVGDSDIEATDDSDSFFYIKGAITNIHLKVNANDADPSVPLDLPIATTRYITWNYAGSLGTVDLSYSTDANVGSPTYTPIPGGTGVSVGTGGVGSFAWTIPNSPSANVRVKVTSSTSANWQTVNGLSFASAGPTYNSIIGSITAVSVVSDTNGTDAVVGANSKTIKWTPNGAIATFDIYYSHDGSTPSIQIANNIPGSVSGSDKTWAWTTIPDTISSTVQYRVVDHGNPTKTYLDSVGTYRIRGSVDLTNPNGSNTLTIGTPYNITWTSTGSIGNLKIEMSTDNFASDVRTIASSYSSANSPYSWTPSASVAPAIAYADMNADIVKIRLTSLGGIPVSDPSANAFKIVGTISGVSPTGSGTIWNVGDSRVISWNELGNIGSVDIYYRLSGGATPYDIPIVTNHTGHASGANSYTWNPVHDVNSEDVWVQVLDHNNASILASSAAGFKIRPVITVTGPTSGQQLTVGNNYNNLIKWSKTGTTISTVKVVYASDGATFTEPGNIIASGVPVANGTAGIAWNIPNSLALTNTYKIRVIDEGNNNVLGDSAAFKLKGGLTLTGPLGSSTTIISASTTNAITWNFAGSIASVRAYYDPNQGLGADGVASNGDEYLTTIGTKAQSGSSGSSSLNWDLSGTGTNTTAVTSKGRVKIVDLADPTNVLYEGTDFNVSTQFSNVQPSAGTPLYVGDTSTDITWNPGPGTGVQYVKIEYTNNYNSGATWNTLTTTAPNTGAYRWSPIPGASADLNNDVKVRITQFSPLNAATTLEGGAPVITIKPVLTVTVPGTGSESWDANTTHTVTFQKRGAVDSVDLYFSNTGDTPPNYVKITATPINTSAAADDTNINYSWTIDPSTNLTSGFTGKIKAKIVTPATQVAVEDVQSNAIEVKGSVVVGTPNASGIELSVGGTYNITWSKFGAVNNVKIYYSTTGGVAGGGSYPAGNLITTVPSTPSTYSWDVPDAISTNARIKVCDSNNCTNVWDESDNVFRIKGSIAITSPSNAGITWTVGQTNKTISWSSTGTYSNVQVHLARFGDFNDAPNVVNIGTFTNCTPVNATTPCAGSANWATVTDIITATAQIRVRDASVGNTDVASVSANPFKIIGSFTSLGTPASGAVWNVGDTSKSIAWVQNGTMTNVKLEYSTGAGFTTIAASDAGHTSGANTYNWTAGIPDVNSETVTIQLSDANFSEVTPITSATFKIRPVITVTGPTSGQQLTVGNNYNNLIKWSKTGTTISTVKVVYASDGATFTEPGNIIASGVPVANGTAGIAWNIPNSLALTNTYKIRVIDEGNNNVLGDSAAFKLKGGLTLTGPLGSSTTLISASTTNAITWNFAGSIASVRAYYDPNQGLGADGVASNGDEYLTTIGTKAQSGSSGSSSLNWDLSGTGTNTTAVTSKGRVKIVDLADPTNVLYEGTDFNVSTQFSNVQPSAGTPLYVGDTSTDITWNPGPGTGVQYVKIEYTNNYNSGATWNTLTTTAPNTGAYRWSPIPGASADLNNDVKVRITQFSPLNAATTLEGGAPVITIKPVLTVTVPGTGSESWDANTTHTVTFQKRGAVDSVDLYFSNTGDTPPNYVKITATPINTSAAADDTNINYSWTIDPSTNLTSGFTGKIKAKIVTPATQVAVEDVQSNAIEVKGSVVVGTPNASGIELSVGGTYNITWSKFGAVNNVKIYYSTTGGVAGGGSYPAGNLITTVPSTPSTYSWDVPDAISTNARIKVCDSNNCTNVWDESDNVFRIKGSIAITSPSNAGITWTVGQTNKTISWSSTGTYSNVQVHLARFGDFNDAPNVVNIGTFTNCTPVNATTPCAGSANWATVTDIITATAQIRVRDASVGNTDVASVSANPFKIIGSFTSLGTPASGAVWNVGDTSKSIAWVQNGTMTNVKLEYSTGAGFTTIAASDAGHTSGANTYNWTAGIPDVNSETVTIQLSDANFSEVTPITSATFKIRPVITVTGPTSGQQLTVGNNYNNLIKWSKTGTTISTVKVVYASDGATFTEPGNIIASGVPVANGTAGIAWNIPNSLALTNTYKIRVIDEGNNNVLGDSAAFKLKGGLTLTGPLGSSTTLISASTTNAITWNFVGSIANVRAYYDPNQGLGADGVASNGDEYLTTIGTKAQSGSSGSSSLNWDLSGTGTNTTAVTSKGRVKIVDLADPTNVLYEGTDFNVSTQFSNVQPSNGTTINAEDTGTLITWNPGAGTGVSAVKIEYSNNATAGSPTWNTLSTTAGNSGTYAWNPVPGALADLSNDIKVRITQYSPLNAATTTLGAGTSFSIKPILTVTSPGSAGNETLKVGTPYAIKLKKNGAVQSVDFYYSYDGTSPNYVKINGAAVDISGAADGQGEYTFNWTPQESHTLTTGFAGRIKAKIVDPTTQIAVEDVQSNGIKLTGGVVLNTPSASGIILEVSDTYPIAWTKYSISNVRLFYSTNAGTPGVGYPADSSPNITTVAAVPSSYTWTVPDAIGTNLRVKVMDDDNVLVTSESANTFQIRGKLILDTPLNGTTQRVDDTVALKWTPKGTMNTVKLEYSTDNFTLAGNIFPVLGPAGESAATLAAGVNNVQQTFTWKIPDNIGNTVRVRVVNNADANVKGTSTQDFKIIGWYDLTDPLGGVGVFKKVDDPFSVTWVRHGSVAQAKVEYSTDGFQTDPANVFLVGTVNSPGQSVSWPIPDAIGSNVKVRVSDPAYNGTTVLTQPSSSAAFEIRGQVKLNPSRTVPGADSPLGGEVWLIGTDHLIQWEKHGTIGNVKVEYKVGAGSFSFIQDASATQATSVAGDTFNWRVPNQKGLNNVVIKVTATGDGNVTTTSNTFTIRAGFSWTNPASAGQVFDQGSTPTITWNTNGTVPTVDLKYSTNGDAVFDGDADPNYVFMKDTLGNNADNVSNNNTFNWPVPTNISASTNVYFVVVDSTDPDAQNVTAKVKIAGVLAMDEPDNNPTVERWGVTTNQTIAWTMIGNVANVKIEYTKDITAGTPVWEAPAIASSVVGTNLSYNWTNIPTAAVSAKAAIRVSDVIATSGTTPAISPLFKITGTFTASAPAAGNVWYTTGSNGAMNNPTRNIVWTTQGTIPNADLYYSTTGNSPGAWTLINTAGPIVDGGAGGSYAWTVPQVYSDNTVIRIQDHDDALTLNYSGVFTTRGHIGITSPVGGEKWGVGEAQSITWDSVGVVGTPNEVYIFYKKSAGGAWIQLQRPTLEYNIPNTGSFAWTPPESELSTDAYVKIENIVAPTDPKYVSTQSPASFKLMRRYQLTSPDGGEIYPAGQAKNITWNKWGTPAGNVRLDLALDGTNFTTNITPTTANSGTFSWTPLATQVAPAAKIRIADVNDTLFEKAYISSAPFVVRATLVLDAMPATVNIGDVYDILWTRQGNIPNVKLVYTTTGNFALDSRPIENSSGTPMAGGIVPNQDTVSGNPTRGRHQWKVPDLILTERANLKVRVVDPNDDPGSENISGNFRVIPKFTVTAPNGNANANLTDKLKVGIPYDITWTSSSSSAAAYTPQVSILYSTNGGGTYPYTITTTANNGSYTWTVPATGGVPDDISTQVKVKVVSANAAEATALAEDASDNNIKIISNFTLTAPNGGATYDVGDPLTITWTKLGTAANVSLQYSKNGSDFSTPFNIVTPTANDLSEVWPGGVPDAIGTNVRVRVTSSTDEGNDISDASFRIKGKLTVTAPTTGTPVPIGQTYRIQWSTNGTIPFVDIVYDTQDGAGGYPNSIAGNVANVGFYDWVNVPDNGTANARIRVIDHRPAESDVIGTSNKFNIVGNFNVLTPTTGDQLTVNSTSNVTWHWGGTIQFVKLSYTTNPALPETDPWTQITVIDFGGASGNGNNGTSTRTYAWTVPDNIAPQVRFKVENATDASVYDVSTGTFRIKGGFVFQSPTGGERWVTNEVRNVTWLTNGTVPFVDLQYSYDNFATAGVTIASNIPNNGDGQTTTYAWTVHDPGIANVPKGTKLRIVNSADPTNYQTLGASFNIDYYLITWEIRDLVTNASLSQLTVNEVKSSNPNFIQWSEAGISTNPPRVQKTPYGTWVATWSKAGFGDGVQVLVANSDQSILLYMETSTVHIWLADSRTSYNPATDILDVVGWLSRDGSITTGAVNAKYKIYDGSTLLYTLNDNTVDAAGFFNFQVAAPTGFVAGKTYSAVCEVTVGSGGVFKTPTSFEVSTAKTLQTVTDTVNSKLTISTTDLQNNIQTTLTQNKADIVTELVTQRTAITTALDNFQTTISSSIVSLESAADQSLASAQTLEDTALKFSWKAVVAPNPALSGTTIILEAQGPHHLFPIVSVYNSDDKQVIINGLMTEDPARPGNYSYAFEAANGSFEPGQAYTFLVSEDVTGGLVAGSGFIESISLTSVAGLAAAAPAAEKAAKEAVKAIKELEASMMKGGDIKDTMKLLKKAVDDLQTSSNNIPERENKLMRDRVAEIADKLKALAGEQGLDFDEIFKKAIDESSTIQDIRNRTGNINQAVELIGAVVEKRLGGVEEPIVDVQLEPAT